MHRLASPRLSSKPTASLISPNPLYAPFPIYMEAATSASLRCDAQANDIGGAAGGDDGGDGDCSDGDGLSSQHDLERHSDVEGEPKARLGSILKIPVKGKEGTVCGVPRPFWPLIRLFISDALLRFIETWASRVDSLCGSSETPEFEALHQFGSPDIVADSAEWAPTSARCETSSSRPG